VSKDITEFKQIISRETSFFFVFYTPTNALLYTIKY